MLSRLAEAYSKWELPLIGLVSLALLSIVIVSVIRCLPWVMGAFAMTFRQVASSMMLEPDCDGDSEVTFTVCIDAGHGGSNNGTTDGEFCEKDYTLQMAKDLQQTLFGLPIDIILTRSHDTELSQAERGAVSRKHKADFVLSIHVNANENAEYYGGEAYFWPTSGIGQVLALRLAALYRCALGKGRVIEARKDMGKWIENPRAILAAHDAPALVAECGFRTNTADRDMLMSRSGRAAIVAALHGAVVRAWELDEQEI